MVSVNPVFYKFNAAITAPAPKQNFSPMSSGSTLPHGYFVNNEMNLKFPWLTNQSLQFALEELNRVEFAANDKDYVKSIGMNIPFQSGKEAIDFLAKSNVRIAFENTGANDIHAQYDFEKNVIRISDKYKNTDDHAEILAISEAILHEAGHAKDYDAISSIQEELDCLAMNALAHRHFLKKNPTIFSNSKSPIINDGVDIYANLFFDPDSQKKALTSRINEKYGYLPAGDYKHPASALAMRIKQG